VPWVITAELFPSAARGKATSIAILVNWLSNFIVSTSIPLIMVGLLFFHKKKRSIHLNLAFYIFVFFKKSIQNYIYLIFGVLIWLFIAFIYKQAPETKNRSIDEIAKDLE
jgi:hypothetical protein